MDALHLDVDTAGSASGTDYGESGVEAESTDYDVPLMIFRVLVCAIGTVGNILVIFVILVLREYEKTVTHWYVLQLAIADTLFLLTLPFKIAEDIHDEWIYTEAMCKMKETILFLNYYSSILFLMIMSIDRYIAVCHGFAPALQKLRTKLAAYVIAGVVWLTSLLLCTPMLMYSTKMGHEPHCKCQYEFPNPQQSPEQLCLVHGLPEDEYLACVEEEKKYINVERCITIDYGEFEDIFGSFSIGSGDDDYSNASTEADLNTLLDQTTIGLLPDPNSYEQGCSYVNSGPGWKAFLSFNFIVMFALPVIIMTVCYTLIILRLKHTRLRSDSNAGENVPSTSGSISGKRRRSRSKSVASVKAEKNRNRVTYMCGALVLLFLACWLPFHTIHLAKMKGIHGMTDYCMKLSSVASVIAYINSALNPYLYNFIGTRFGKRLRSAAGSVRTSVKKRTSSLSSSGATVRYRPNRKHDGASSSTGNTGTVVTKIYKGKHDILNMPESSCANDVFEEDAKQSFEQQPLVEFKIAQTPEKTVDKD